MKTIVLNILKQHLLPFVGYLAAFIAPAGALIISLEVVLILETAIGKYAKGKGKGRKKIPTYSVKQVVIKTGIYVWLILVLRVVDLAFFEGQPYLSNVMAGYLVWDHLKQLIKNIDFAFGSKIWQQIQTSINRIKL